MKVYCIDTELNKNSSYSPKTVVQSHLRKAFPNIKYVNRFNQIKKPENKVVICSTNWDKKRLTQRFKAFRKINNKCGLMWFKPSCVNSMTDLEHIVKKKITTFYSCLNGFKHFIWEPPQIYNPFIYDTVRVQMRSYDYTQEEKIKKKKYDFLFFVDKMRYNLTKSIMLMNKLKRDGYKVHAVCIKAKDMKKVKSYMRCKVHEGKKPDTRKMFHKLLDDTKVMVDLSYRWTVGRTVNEALYHGALSVCPYTYAASHQVMPYYMIDSWKLNMSNAYRLCENALGNWSRDWINTCREKARENGYEKFLKELKQETRRLTK